MNSQRTNPLFLVLLLSLFRITDAHATVNLRDASYSTDAVDLDLSSRHEALALIRGYNSRSRFNGIFGFGWCTPFEARLNSLSDGRVSLADCELGIDLIFEKRPGKESWTTDGSSAESMVSVPGHYFRTTARGWRQDFDSVTGRLLAIEDRRGRRLSLEYDRGGSLPKRLLLAGQDVALTFTYAGNAAKVVKATASDGRMAAFLYKGLDLVSAKGRRTFVYEYDELHNLTGASADDRVKETIAYDRDLDRVSSVIGAGGCSESYSYDVSRSPRLVVAEAKRSCSGKLDVKLRYEFHYRIDASHAVRSLEKLTVVSARDRSEVRFPANERR